MSASSDGVERICESCGAGLPTGAAFCGGCGRALDRKALRARQRRELRVVPTILLVFGGTFAALFAASSVQPVDGPTLGSILLGNLFLILAGVVAASVLGRRSTLLSFGGGCTRRDLGRAVVGGLMAFGMAWLYIQVLRVVVSGMVEDTGDVPDPFAGVPIALIWLQIAFFPPLLEEWLCRGLLWQAARQATTERVTIVLTASLFAFLHGLNGALFLEFPHRFAAGVVFGWLRARSGSLIPGIVAHFIVNALAILTV